MNGSFIDEHLEEHFADLVYECALSDGSGLTIALLLEHKSYAVKYPQFQLMRYMLNYWEQDVEHSKRPTPIVPVIIYHGEDRWIPATLYEQMEYPPAFLHRFVPNFDYLLIDFSKIPDEQLFNLRSRFLAVSASLLKHSDKRKLKAFVLKQFSMLLRSIDNRTLEQFVSPVFRYIYEQSNLTGVEIVGIFKRISLEKEHIAMTVYQQETLLFRREGLEIGRLEGLQQGLQEGMQQGMQQGIQQGMQQGRLEVLRVAVKALHEAGQTPKQIAAQFKIKVGEVKTLLQQEG